MDNAAFIEELKKQCETCYYWRDLHSGGPTKCRTKCCHFILYNCQLTKRDGTTCYSYTPRRRYKNG